MPIDLFLKRLTQFYTKNGILKSGARISQKVYQAVFKSAAYIYYCDLTELGKDQIALPEGYQLVARNSMDQVSDGEIERLSEYLGRDITVHTMKHRFECSATLWLGKIDEIIYYFGWSIREKPLKPYYLPLGKWDALIFDGAVFPAQRGRNITPYFVTQTFHELKKEGCKRAFIDAFEWNRSSNRTIIKMPVRLLGIAKRIYIPGKNVVIWKPLDPSEK